MHRSSLPVILVIDANAASREMARAALPCQDYDVYEACSHAAAIQAAASLPLDLIICDVNLRGVKGTSIVADIRMIPDRHDVPVMFASQAQSPDVIRRTHDFGGAYHLKKPFDPGLLIELVERALWMPALMQSHIAKPHFNIGPAAPAVQSAWAPSPGRGFYME